MLYESLIQDLPTTAVESDFRSSIYQVLALEKFFVNEKQKCNLKMEYIRKLLPSIFKLESLKNASDVLAKSFAADDLDFSNAALALQSVEQINSLWESRMVFQRFNDFFSVSIVKLLFDFDEADDSPHVLLTLCTKLMDFDVDTNLLSSETIANIVVANQLLARNLQLIRQCPANDMSRLFSQYARLLDSERNYNAVFYEDGTHLENNCVSNRV